MESLCAHLLPLGLLPRVVPEFRQITIGGAVMGLGIESSSFRHGLFEFAVVRNTEPLHIYDGLWRPGASHPANMQSIWPSHGAP